MSLQVWLPLNGSLKNLGLNGVIPTNNGAIINNAGKIGKCYSFGTAASDITLPATSMTNFTTEASVSFWIKILSWNTSYATFFLAGPASTAWTAYRFGILRNNANSNLCFTISSSSSASNANYTTSNLELDTWYHLSFCYKTGHCLIYINGALYKDYTTTIVPDFAGITTVKIGRCTNGSSYQTNCLLNDFRIYDHCLSDKEVEEIAKGLVVHYKLDNNGIGNNNILVNTHFDNRYSLTTGWDVSKNGTLLANSWGGYNSGVTNLGTVYHAHLKEFNGEYVYEFIKTANESWLGISQGGLQNYLIAGLIYTFSWEEYHIDGTNRVGTGLYYFKTGASSANFHLGILLASDITRVIGSWQKYSYTFIAPDDADYNKNMSWYIYGHYNGNGTFYVRHPKLEIGNLATIWVPHQNDPIYKLYNLSSVYDSSGYNNNGIFSNSANIKIIADSPKYSHGIHLDKTKINCSTGFPTGNNPDFTIVFWTRIFSNITYVSYGDLTSVYDTDLGNNTFRLELCGSPASNNLMWFRGPSGQSGGGFNMNTNSTSGWFSKDTWHLIALTGNGQTKLYICYLDGILCGTYNGSANSWSPTGEFAIGDTIEATADFSDYRIYSTVLSPEAILELYNTSATIDNKSNIYARELVEI